MIYEVYYKFVNYGDGWEIDHEYKFDDRFPLEEPIVFTMARKLH